MFNALWKKNNILNYYIIYIEFKRILIIQFKLNLMDYSNEREHIFLINELDQYGNILEIKGNSINCIFMSPLDSLNINHD